MVLNEVLALLADKILLHPLLVAHVGPLCTMGGFRSWQESFSPSPGLFISCWAPQLHDPQRFLPWHCYITFTTVLWSDPASASCFSLSPQTPSRVHHSSI